MLVTHWGLSGPVILRLSAWGARDLSISNYKGIKILNFLLPVSDLNIFICLVKYHTRSGILEVDFAPDLHAEDVKSVLNQHKNRFPVIIFLTLQLLHRPTLLFLLLSFHYND